jgi:hypothetical protein
MPRKKPADKTAVPVAALPDHWPRYTTPEYYSWMMARMPVGAIAADWSKHQPHKSHSPLFWYADEHNICEQCGREFLFSKTEQRHWYEDLQIPIYVRGAHCPECRALRRAAREAEQAEQQQRMAEAAARKPNPNDAFFRKKR